MTIECKDIIIGLGCLSGEKTIFTGVARTDFTGPYHRLIKIMPGFRVAIYTVTNIPCSYIQIATAEMKTGAETEN